ncbi:MAG: hypothetical protein AAFV72_06860 [Cyanobacteria bacterium J06635_1]
MKKQWSVISGLLAVLFISCNQAVQDPTNPDLAVKETVDTEAGSEGTEKTIGGTKPAPGVDRSQSIEDENRQGEFLWLKVATTEGQEGYVEGQFVRSPIDYRALFKEEEGQWVMTFFAAGD